MMATDHLGQVISLYKALDCVILQERNTDLLVCLRYTCQLDSDVGLSAKHSTHNAARHPSIQVDNIGNKIT